MMMRLISPRSTAPYQTLDSSSRITSPSTVAPGTTHALEWMVGPFCNRGTIPSCPVGSESGSICIRDERERWNVQPAVRKTTGRRTRHASRVCPVASTLQNCNKKACTAETNSVFIARMPSKITLALGTALAGIALCCFIESGFAQDALVASIAEKR